MSLGRKLWELKRWREDWNELLLHHEDKLNEDFQSKWEATYLRNEDTNESTH